jgi:hypothetical protein
MLVLKEEVLGAVLPPSGPIFTMPMPILIILLVDAVPNY